MPARLPDGTWVTDDGVWHLESNRWQPVPPALPGRPGILWFTSVRGWFMPALVAGAIGLIPIVGFMNLYGWSLATASNLRLGYRVPAPSDFRWIGRGARYVAWSLAVGFLLLLLTAVAGIAAGAAAYAARRDWAWTIAVGLVASGSLYAVLAWMLMPLTVPVLDLIEREGLAAAFTPGRLVATVRRRWDAGWYGAVAVLAWGLAFVVASSFANFVPLVGPLAGLAVTAPAYGVLGLMLAAPLARAGDPPESFDRTQTWLAAGLYGAALMAMVALLAASAFLAANLVSGHPEETSCFFIANCDFSYSGDRETITRVNRDGHDSGLIRVTTTFINRGHDPAAIYADEYWLSPSSDATRHNPPSSDCPTPGPTVVPAGARVTQEVCFRVADQAPFDVNLPWTGLDSKTG